MALTEAHLLDLGETYAEIYNIRYFDGSLKFKVAVHVRAEKKRYAWFNHLTDTITLNPVMCAATIEEIELIIVHELIHVAQKALKADVSRGWHGKSFRDIAKQFGIPSASATRCANPDHVRHTSQMKAALGVKK